MTTMSCGLNFSEPLQGNGSCGGGAPLYRCLCRESILCCEDDECAACMTKESESLSAARTLSWWALLAGGLALMWVLVVLGRRPSGRRHQRQSTWGSLLRQRQREEEASERREVEMRRPVTVKTRVLEEDPGENNFCCICLNALEKKDVVASLKCEHLYHHECLLLWLSRKATCPLCARAIDLEDEEPRPTLPT